MGAAELILRVAVATVLVLMIGLLAVAGFGFVVEPTYAAIGEPANSLGWGTPGTAALNWAGAGFLSLLLVLALWLVFAPIKDDVRQEFGRRP